ncbi:MULTISPECIES: ABC transporter ATP-binding protein [Psychrilyobacter]|uniref:ATP-binding cassette domain-containing protein n=1 Tax=Psychrilyobacter piezotolerans TaxID=2293438 RepID=A0ABX9KGS0_9FUSO|nr:MULTISPECIES: ATP-binding cassette domain-containing protein [Psychrilyobacter]MCS5420730.1 ATP-binding cassette domain-containing protein [Psychrilyobacter sp. S5]NDI77994.1 ATP-binding cassette domain-containing protein [Psychrilyobacter piezotolerans]RDE61937.1 ATP-binding cassette domain-containing protein [Psychrilyobacter sp. S5]REI41163.1 ATP-binding cassette domain-containing protein [Psychrilyobacter piezotolerans]
MIKLEEINLKLKQQPIFINLNLQIKKNQKILLKMPSGAGKSTLLKVIMGYIPIDSGRILIDGEVLGQNNIDTLRQKFAYIGQNILFTEDSVEKYIHLIFSFQKNKGIKLSNSSLYELLEKFELDKSILKKSPSLLSGGEKQRIALILVLLLDREILLLDEVTSGLDHDLKIKVIEIIKNLNKTVIVSSHDNQWLDYDEFQVMGW